MTGNSQTMKEVNLDTRNGCKWYRPVSWISVWIWKNNKIHISQKLIGNTVGEMTRKRRMTNYLKAYKHTYAIMQIHACVKRCSCDFITHLLFRAQLCTTVRMHNSDSNSHAHRSFYFYALCQPSSTMREDQVKSKSKKKNCKTKFWGKYQRQMKI